jgi:hypothetical protein
MNTPDDFRGMVSETHVSSINAGSATSICPGTSVTLSVTGGTGATSGIIMVLLFQVLTAFLMLQKLQEYIIVSMPI